MGHLDHSIRLVWPSSWNLVLVMRNMSTPSTCSLADETAEGETIHSNSCEVAA